MKSYFGATLDTISVSTIVYAIIKKDAMRNVEYVLVFKLSPFGREEADVPPMR